MMIDPRVQTLVRECRNMQLHVLLVLWASPRPLLAKELAQVINCSTDSIRDALPNLEFNGYVAQFPGGRHPRWWLTDKGRQLVLPGLMLIDDTGKTPLTFPETPEGERGKTPLTFPETPGERGKTPLTFPETPEGERGKTPLTFPETPGERGKTPLTFPETPGERGKTPLTSGPTTTILFSPDSAKTVVAVAESEGLKSPLSPNEISTFLGEVTDHGLMCLFVLWANPQPVTIGDIETITGVCRHTTSDALDRLKLHGYAAVVGGGRWPRWTLTDRGRQLSLPGLNAPGLAENDGQKMTINPPTTTTAILPSLNSAKAVVATSVDGQKMTINPPAIDAKLAAAFKAAGIGSNAWPGLAKLEHITPDFVKAHDEYRRGRGENTGMLITRLRCGDAVPEKDSKPVRDVAADWQKVIDQQRGGKRRK